jgi:hypothetical protein
MENENNTTSWKVFDRFDGAGDVPQAVLVQLNDPIAVAKAQGAIASISATYLPSTTKQQVYSGLATQLQSKLADQGIDATVTVVSPSKYAPSVPPTFTKLGYFVAGAAAASLACYIHSKMKKGRR